ncbi:arylesterase [Paracoccus rhizosphaerae]|uniref:Arylesterase n=1 Tax=Paracoccus rhizosphaerae TaxID=1133347 RepID=A0ABV6CFH3_9RHOB|nr:arylesterase [Paracoccus rhizosphaerae]
MTMNRRQLLVAAALTMALPACAVAQTPPRVLCFGDSLTAGYGLPQGQGLVPQLSDWLEAHGHPARLIDAGASGDTTEDGRKRIGPALRKHRPDAVIVELGGNDMLQGWPPEQAEGNLDAILTAAGQGGRPLLLVGVEDPGRDPGSRAAWAAIWPRLALRHDALVLPNLYAPLVAMPRDRQAGLLLDGVHPSAKGVQLMVDHLGPVAAQLVRRAA